MNQLARTSQYVCLCEDRPSRGDGTQVGGCCAFVCENGWRGGATVCPHTLNLQTPLLILGSTSSSAAKAAPLLIIFVAIFLMGGGWVGGRDGI